jgi:hypothetical protein
MKLHSALLWRTPRVLQMCNGEIKTTTCARIRFCSIQLRHILYMKSSSWTGLRCFKYCWDFATYRQPKYGISNFRHNNLRDENTRTSTTLRWKRMFKYFICDKYHMWTLQPCFSIYFTSRNPKKATELTEETLRVHNKVKIPALICHVGYAKKSTANLKLIDNLIDSPDTSIVYGELCWMTWL